MAKLSNYEFGQNINQQGQEKPESVEDAYNKYKDLSASQLQGALAEEVARQKADGSFDFDKLENMVESLSGYLPAQTYQNVKRIMQSLK